MPSPRARSRVPLYERIYNDIGAQIAAGALSRSGRLPPEREISEQLGVSRATVRRAMAALEADGLIEAVQGRGTFVTAPRLVEPPNALMSFTELARSRSTTAGAVVLEERVRPATIDEADAFRVAPGTELFDLKRLRTVDTLPVAIDRTIVPLPVAPTLPDHDWASTSLYEALTESGSRVVRADYTVESRAATADNAEHLKVTDGAPILVAETRGYTREGRLVEIGHIEYRGDRYRFRATLITQPSLGGATPAQ